VTDFSVPGYTLRSGSGLDRALLLQFMQRTHRELYPHNSYPHLAETIDRYLSPDTPLWWVEASDNPRSPVGCLWLGNVVDQVQGDRHAYILLLYVHPQHRRQGIGSALLQRAESWAIERGDRQIGLQVFCQNQAAIYLYKKMGYKTQSLWMNKVLGEEGRGK
jgi:ribosomal protein S18 acetylase RimI-like enzyme